MSASAAASIFISPAAVRERELVQPLRQGASGEGDRWFIAHGEVGEAEPPRRMLLSEEDLALTAVFGAP